jgi:N-acetylmuramoyl-L-alanine amidase
MSLPNKVAIPFPIDFITIPTSNYSVGRSQAPDCIVIHIAEGSKASVVGEFQNAASQLSSHFLVNQNGSVTQFVGTANVAFGNGIVDNPTSELLLQRPGINPNQWTISIEHEGFSTSDFTEAQYATTSKLIKYLHDEWNIPLDSTHVIRHREINGGKTCPGVVNVERIIRQARLV